MGIPLNYPGGYVLNGFINIEKTNYILMKKYALALDLIDDAKLIAEYESYHKEGWPEVMDSIIASGILKMEIFRVSNRLFMLIETTADFTFDRKQKMDQNNVIVQQWEKLMWNFQQPLPCAGETEKWVLMDRIFDLEATSKDRIND